MKKAEVLGKGSFGCVVKPNYPCSSSQKKSKSYVSKIQNFKSVSDRETAIGLKIRDIPNYSTFFSPVLETCPITFASVELDELKECGFINQNKETTQNYSVNKMKYVGRQNITVYLTQEFQKNPKQIFRLLFKSHTDILKSLTILNTSTIVHNDLRSDNILCKDKTGKPIIIDFGQAYDDELVNSKDYKNVFETYGPDYWPWCIELHVICYIVFVVKDTLQNITTETLEKIVDEVKSKNKFFNLFTDEENDTFITGIKKYLTRFNGKTGGDIITELIAYRNTWDNFAVAFIYYRLVSNMYLASYFTSSEYITLLKSILLAMPNTRLTAEKTRVTLMKLSRTLPKKTTKQEELKVEKENSKKIDTIRTNVASAIYDEVKIEEELLSKKLAHPIL